MKTTVRIRYDDQQPASNVLVRVLAPTQPQAVRDLSKWQVLAEGKTSANGRWLFSSDDVEPKMPLVLMVLNPETDAVLHRTRPVLARRIPELVQITISRTPLKPGEVDLNDIDPDPDLDGTPDDETGPEFEEPVYSFTPRPGYSKLLAARLSRKDSMLEAETEVTSQRTKDDRTERQEIAIQARKLLGRRPLRGLGGKVDHFVPEDEDSSDRESLLKEEGVARISKRPHARGILLRKGELANRLPKVGQSIAPDAFDRILPNLMPGNVAARRMSVLRACQIAHEHEAAVATIKSASAKRAVAAAATSENAGPAAGTQAALDRIIDSALANLPGATRPTRADIDANLNNDLPLGPADVTAYYDFHVLQLAWEDTWTGLVDPSMVEDVQRLYDTMVRLVPPGVDRKKLLAELAEITELEQMLETFAEIASAMSGNIGAGNMLAGWLPEIGSHWLSLSPVDREHLNFLYDLHVFVQDLMADKQLSFAQQTFRRFLQNKPLRAHDQFADAPEDWLPQGLSAHMAQATDWATSEARAILDSIPNTGPNLGRVEGLIKGLKLRIARPYQFDVFRPGSYNYGLVTTYRQKWQPDTYQAGDLAATLPLAPNEKRRFKVRQKVVRSTGSTGTTIRQDNASSESTTTARSESEIKRRTESVLNSEMNFEAGYQAGFSFSGGGAFGFDQTQESEQIKRAIRETTRKKAQEFRDERKMELTESTTFERETTEEREISNPNSELTVTYLFYELQRRFKVRESLHDLTPAVLVAYPVPRPQMIDEVWLMTHDWILEKVLLDPGLKPTLKMLSQDFAGDEIAVEVLEEQWKTQILLVARMGEQLQGHADLQTETRRAVQEAANQARREAELAEAEAQPNELEELGKFLTQGVGYRLLSNMFRKMEEDQNLPPTSIEESAAEVLEWVTSDLTDAREAMRRGVSGLERATEAYLSAVRQRLDRRVRIDKLILHVKTNILHYMRAIWMHEDADTRYMRLYDKVVAWPEWDGPVEVKPVSFDDLADILSPVPPGAATTRFEPVKKLALPGVKLGETRKLHEVADLSRIIGFKGNYAVFALRESNALTTSMAQDFLDSAFGIADPAPLAELPTAEEAIEIVRCAWDSAEGDLPQQTALTEWLLQVLEAAHAAEQEIAVPTGQLFIEALPGSHPLLEDYQLKHRAHDAARAAAMASQAQLEVVRRAERVRDNDLTDPDIDRRIEVLGADTNLTISTED